MSLPQTLTKHGVQLLANSTQSQNNNIVVQILNPILLHNKDTIACLVSDGVYSIKGFINNPNQKDITKQLQNCVILIQSHFKIQGTAVSIQKYQIIGKYKSSIGQPINYFKQNNPVKQIQKIILKKQLFQTLQVKSQSSSISIQLPMQAIKQTDTIKQLWSGAQNWQIVARIIQKQFKQFMSNKGKKMKVLNLILIDRSNVKISGVFFNQAAQKQKDILKQGCIYRICKGQISQQTFLINKNKNFSKFKITFNQKSPFQPIAQINIIPKGNQLNITLGQMYQKKDFQNDYDVVAILLDIKQQIDIPRQGKILKKRNLTVCDPQRQIKMNVILWNQKIQPDKKLLKKTILLNNFKLNLYQQTLSLQSNIRSYLTHIQGHKFCQYQNKLQPDTYTMVSQKNNIQDDGHTLNDLKDLKQSMQYMEIKNKPIKSQLTVWVNDIHVGRKWFYQGCSDPKCKKAAQRGLKCQKCGIDVDRTIPHFIMSVQLSDPFGSIDVTAYDDFAHKIFRNQQYTQDSLKQHCQLIDYLNNLSHQDRIKQVSKYLYKQYKVIVYSSIQNNYPKHKIGKILDYSFNLSAKNNLKKIRAF